MAKTLPEYATRLTGSKFRPEVQRLQTDNAETSFEDNKQFRFFDEWHDNAETPEVSGGDIIVYKLDSVNPIIINSRVLDAWEGSRTYQVFADNGVTFNGTLVDQQSKIHYVNNILNQYITTHPMSGVTVSRYIGAEDFTSTAPAVNGTVFRVSGATSQRTSTYTQGGERGGVAAGTTFYLVLKSIDSNTATQGMFKLAWEEIIED